MQILRLHHLRSGEARAVEVRLPLDATIADLRDVLGESGPALASSVGTLHPDLPLREAGLLDGDAVGGAGLLDGDAVGVAGASAEALADPAGRLLPPPGTERALVIVGGPAAGRWVPLADDGDRARPVVLDLGRDPSADVPLHDPTVSLRHARLAIGPDGVRAQDLRSRNGTRVGEAEADEPVPLGGDEVLHLGATSVRLLEGALPRPPGRPPAGTAGARVRVPRAPRTAPEPPPPLPPAPSRYDVEAPRSSPGAATLVIPLVFGLAMGVLFAPLFALFALLGPAVAAGQWIDERRRHRRELRRADRDLRAQLEAFDGALARWRSTTLEHLEQAAPDPAVVVACAVSGGPALWTGHGARDTAGGDTRGDAGGRHLSLRLGRGPGRLTPPRPPGAELAAEVATLLACAERSGDLPVSLRLESGDVLTIVGPRDVTEPVIRWLLLQAAVRHPPAALTIGVLTDDPSRWRAATWLPHARDGSAELVGPPSACDTLMAARPELAFLLLVDVRDADVLLDRLPDGSRHVCLVRVEEESAVPPSSTWVLRLGGASAGATLRRAGGPRARGLVADGVDADLLLDAARVLARWDDGSGARSLPSSLALGELVAPDGPAPAAIRRRWQESNGRLAAPLGRDADGPVVLDLEADGPHALVAGTTGAGKSELLLSLVLGLAASCPPDRLAFLLFDFKGGSTFDACAELPHTTDVLTDLDGQGAARALRCLQAEVRRREELLRAGGHRDLDGYRRGAPDVALPSLLIVVDEFAVLAEEHPDVLEALVDVARRGRSLGLHLVLATQRPAGVLTNDIRANTAIRIALRVEDRDDARDVVGTGAPADFPRSTPGRALLRVGGAGPTVLQTACASVAHGRPSLRLLGGPGPAVDTGDHATAAEFVRACQEAARLAGVVVPASVLVPPLPRALAAQDLPAPAATRVPIGLVDRPHRQRREPLWWRPEEGPLVGVGAEAWRPGMAAALAVVHGLPSDATHVQVLAVGHHLDPLGDHPHCGSVVHASDRDRLERLLHHLRLGDRGRPPVVLVIDDLPALLRRLDRPADLPVREALESLLLEGHEHGVHLAVGVPLAATTPSHLVPPGALLLVGGGVDRHEASALGVGAIPRPDAGDALAPGRVTVGPDGDLVQLVTGPAAPRPLVAAADGPPAGARPFPCPPTPGDVHLDRVLLEASELRAGRWSLAIGRRHVDLAPAILELPAGGRALVAGPAGSGRSSLLAVVATTVRHHRPEVPVTLLAPGRSPAGEVAGVRTVASAAAAVEAVAPSRPPGPARGTGARPATGAPPADGGTRVLLVDDAERFADDAGLTAVLERPDIDLRVIAAGRGDRLRATYGGWLGELRHARAGVALRPDADTDGSLWDAVLPRRAGPVTEAGHGELLRDGQAVRVLVARP